MRPPEARAGREAVKGSVTVWRPWQLKQLELCQAVAVSHPSYQQFTQEYKIISVQSGTVDFQYRNTRNCGQVVGGTLAVLEPGEAWSSQAEELSFSHVFIDPAWFQEVASEQLHWEK